MLRGVDKGLLPLLNGVKGIATSAAAAQYAPAVKLTGSSGLVSIFGSSRVNTPLSEPLSGVLIPAPEKSPATAPTLASSALASGTKVATLDTPGPIATVSLTVPSGSSLETSETAGAAYFLPHLAFKSTTHRSTFRLVRELEKFSAVTTSSSTREQISYTVDFPKLFVPEAVELLLDAALNQKFNPWEVSEAKHSLESSLASLPATALLTELLHRTAFDGALGRPYLPDPSALAALTPEALATFVASTFSASSAVLAGAGVSNSALNVAADALVTSSSPAASSASTYMGGAVNSIADTPLSHVAVAFEAKGGLSTPKSAATVAVLSALLDHREPIPFQHKQSEGTKSLKSLAHLYKSTGLVGLVGSIEAGHTSKLLDTITHRLHAVAKGVSAADLAAAKGAVLGAYLSTVQSKHGLVGEIASQLLNTGKFDQLAYVSQVQSLSEKDVAGFVAAALKTPATVVTHGTLSGVPRYQEVARRFS